MIPNLEKLLIWRYEDFELILYDTHKYQDGHRKVLAYKFYADNELLFEGSDFSPPPMYKTASIHSVMALLSFLTLQPGDTDDDYFKDHTEKQLTWLRRQGENLSLLPNDFENYLKSLVEKENLDSELEYFVTVDDLPSQKPFETYLGKLIIWS